MRTIRSFTDRAAAWPRRALALFVALALLSGVPAVAEMAPASADSFAQEAQQYLVDSLIGAFPDDFHFAALDETLQGLTHLSAQVDLRSVVVWK